MKHLQGGYKAVRRSDKAIDWLAHFAALYGRCEGCILTVMTSTGEYVRTKPPPDRPDETTSGHLLSFLVRDNHRKGEFGTLLIHTHESRTYLDPIVERGGVLRIHIDHIPEHTFRFTDARVPDRTGQSHIIEASHIEVVALAEPGNFLSHSFGRWDKSVNGLWLPFHGPDGELLTEYLVCYSHPTASGFEVDYDEKMRRLEAIAPAPTLDKPLDGNARALALRWLH
jgi:hypothetical protein